MVVLVGASDIRKCSIRVEICCAVACRIPQKKIIVKVIIQLSDPSRAGLILPSKQEEKFNILMLLMPLLITN